MTTPDFDRLKALFPSLREWVYMVTHSFGPCPLGTFVDLEAYRTTLWRRPALFDTVLERYEEMHGLLEQVLGAPPGTVALRDTATACHAAILAALPMGSSRNRIVVAETHFPSMRYLVDAQRIRGFVVDVVASAGPHLRADDLVRRLDADVAAVCAPVVSSFNGAILDIDPLVTACASAGAVALLDAYSAIGVLPLDVSRLGPCVVVGGTVKWLCGGGTGLAFMYVHPDLALRLVSAYPGWLGDERPLDFAAEHRPAAGARKFQQGTPAIEAIFTARAGVRFVLEHGVAALRERNREQLDGMMVRARHHGLRVDSPSTTEHCVGCIAVDVDDAHATVEQLRTLGIAIDSRRSSRVRLGPHACVPVATCENVIDEIAVTQKSTSVR